MKLKPKICTDPKQLALITWTIIANNPVNKLTYLIFSFLDFIIISYYSFNLVQRVHFSNFQNNDNLEQSQDQTKEQQSSTQTSYIEGNADYNSAGIKLSMFRDFDIVLQSFTRNEPILLLIMTSIVLGCTLLILATLFAMSVIIKNHTELEKSNILKKCLCLILVSLQTYLHMPIFDIIIRTLFSFYADTSNLAMQLVSYFICSLTIASFAILMLYIMRIFNICVPTTLVPWCGPTSKLPFLNLLIKAALVVSNAFEIDGNLTLIIIIVLFLLQSFQAGYRLLFAPNYVKEVDIFIKTKDFAICLIFFIGIVCKALGDHSNYDFVYFIVFLPVVTYGWMIFEDHRKRMILLKVKTKQLKMEIEYEFALYVMMTLVRDSLSDSFKSQRNFGQLMDLMLSHIEECDDQLCICDEMENFYELIRLRQLHNQEVFPLLRKERKRFKKIIDDQGLIGTVSNITDTTLKLGSTESTLSKQGSNEGDKLDRGAEDEGIQSMEENNHAPIAKRTKDNILGGGDTSQKRKSLKSQVFKINIDEVKHRFLSELLYLFYFEIIQRFPDSFKIQLLSNYFALQFKQKEMLCVFQMRSFVKQRLSKLDQYCHYLNEQYLLWEINKIHNAAMHSNQNNQEGNFNGEYFIQMNQLYSDYSESIEALSQSVSNFWKIFERPSIDVEATQICGTLIARNIQSFYKVFNKLDSLKIFKDYQMYFQFAIVQLHILNDPVAYELYIGKMKSILEINKIYQKNFSQQGQANSDFSNFIIVDANGTRFGQIIQVNNSLRLLLGWTEEEALRNRIESFMPSLIKEKHNDFMGRYNKTGQSFIINNKVTMFIKKVNGFVIPVELYIKFHYSIDYQYTFLAIVNPFYEMVPFTNGVKYNINQLLFLLVDNDESGRITEFSETCVAMLKTFGITFENESNAIAKHVTEIITDLNFDELRKSRQDRYISNEVYENIHRVDLNQFTDSNSMSYEHNKRTGSLKISMLQNNGGIMHAKTRIFEERYSGGVLDMNIICLALINENEGSNLGSALISDSKSRGALISQSKQIINNPTIDANNTVKEADAISVESGELKSKLQEDSQSVTASSSSMRSSTTSMAEFRSFHSFNEQATPKTLILIIRLIVFLYIVMITIASVNLGINISRQIQSESDVHTVRQAFDRMNWISMNQLLVRVLLNIANGYEPEQSILIPDRYNEYSQLSVDRTTKLKNTESQLQTTPFAASDEFHKFKDSQNVPLYYLSEQNKEYSKKETMNIAFNLYIAKLNEINSYSKQNMRGNLQIQTLNSQNSNATYRPTYQEQSLYFIVQNGNKELRQFAIDASQFYARESENHAEQNITSTKVTAIISIVIIVIIGLIIAPILTQAEIRKYKALLYFLKIPKAKFPDLIKNCEYCLNMNDEDRYAQIMKDYEDYLGVKIANQQVEQLRQARDEMLNLKSQQSREGGDSSGGTTAIRSSGVYSSVASDVESATRSRKKGAEGTLRSGNKNGQASSSDAMSQSAFPQESIIGSSVSQQINNTERRIKTEKTHALQQKKDQDEAMMIDEHDQNQQDADLDKKDEEENQNKFNLANLNLKQNRKDKKKQKEVTLDEAAQEKAEKDEEEHDELQEITQKRRMINAQAYKRRSTMVFSSLSIILIISTYFIISYFLAMKTFETAAEVIMQLEAIFYKGTCFDSAMNFLRESEIRNESMMIQNTVTTDSQENKILYVATDYYIDFCFAKEATYNKMRVNLPKFFEKAANFINAMESTNMCDSVYQGDFAYLNEPCKTALNGLLNKGLTNAFYHMFTQILKANLAFKSLGETVSRDDLSLRKLMYDETIVQIIDMKAKILDPVLNQLKQQCMESVIEYIQMLLNNFVIAYSVFMTLLTLALIGLIFIGFRMLRKSMWGTNVILKIIPFETLPKNDRVEIKDFFNS